MVVEEEVVVIAVMTTLRDGVRSVWIQGLGAGCVVRGGGGGSGQSVSVSIVLGNTSGSDNCGKRDWWQ